MLTVAIAADFLDAFATTPRPQQKKVGEFMEKFQADPKLSVTAGLPDWQPGQPRPATWSSHIHPPRYACGTVAAGPPSSTPAAPAAWQMTRGQYQDYCKAQGRTDVNENSRTYWREVESAVQSGKPVPPAVLAEYRKLKGTR